MDAPAALAKYRSRRSPKMQAACESFNQLTPDERMELVFMMIMATNGVINRLLEEAGIEADMNIATGPGAKN